MEQSYLVLFCAHASRLHDHVQSLVLTILVRGPGAVEARALGGLSWGCVTLDVTHVTGLPMVRVLDSAVVFVTCISAEGGIGARLIKFTATVSKQVARSTSSVPPKRQGFEGLAEAQAACPGL